MITWNLSLVLGEVSVEEHETTGGPQCVFLLQVESIRCGVFLLLDWSQWEHRVSLCQLVESGCWGWWLYWYVHCSGRVFFLMTCFNEYIIFGLFQLCSGEGIWWHCIWEIQFEDNEPAFGPWPFSEALTFSPGVSSFLDSSILWTCEGLCLWLSLWVRGHPRIMLCYWSASQSVCCQKHLACSLSVSLVKRNTRRLLSFGCPCEVKEKVEITKVRQKAGERESKLPTSGRQHKLVWGKI